MSTFRAEFLAPLGFQPDPFQVEALDALDAGDSVLVAAPTGSGKTLVAEYAVAKAIREGKKVFYTTPLKALSNQKFNDFMAIYGDENVGLLTGDNSVNGEAPIVIMTTEVLRNMIYAGSSTLDDLRYVVLDEVHYLQDPYRGAVWEEVIIQLPPEVDLVCLSATVSNAEDVADWVQAVRGKTTAIIEERRPVELTHLYAVSDRTSDRLNVLPTFQAGRGGTLVPNYEGHRFDSPVSSGGPRRSGRKHRVRASTPGRAQMVDWLATEDMLPGVMFIFSRKGCDEAVRTCLQSGLHLTNAEERQQIRWIAEQHTAALSDDDCRALGWSTWLTGLEAGFAAHHAGMVPPMKEAVEDLFAAGLVKMVFATDTLSLGINMPARSVTIEKLQKFTGETRKVLTAGEYTQLAGRAGRRGIDTMGFVIVEWSPYIAFDEVAGLASNRTYELTSSFRPTYNMASNLIRRYNKSDVRHVLNLSFAQHQAKPKVLRIERRIADLENQLAQQRARLFNDAAEVASYQALVKELAREREARRSGRAKSDALEKLQPGDVIRVGGPRGPLSVVLKQEGQGRNARVRVVNERRQLVRLNATDFQQPPVALGKAVLPAEYAPKRKDYLNAVVKELKRVERDFEVADRDGAGVPHDREVFLAEKVEAHPLHEAFGIEGDLEVIHKCSQLRSEIDRLKGEIDKDSDRIAAKFDGVLGVLKACGYVRSADPRNPQEDPNRWYLTAAGDLLSRLYSECDLLIAESLRQGLYNGLEPAEVAALTSCFIYSARTREARNDPLPPPTKPVARRIIDLHGIATEIRDLEDDKRVVQTRLPDPGFATLAYRWVNGKSLSHVLLEADDMTGGDFVRNIRQLIDVLRQVSDATKATHPEVSLNARAAADACFRGVIAASSVLEAQEEREIAGITDQQIDGVFVNGEPLDAWEADAINNRDTPPR